MKLPLIIDCFAGGGGASVGIEMALGRSVDIAINHDPDAILMHKTNHPNTQHLTEDIFKVDLEKYVAGRHVALMWASPDCFPAGNLVWTLEGYKNIEDIQCYDYVLTHKGNYKRVYRTIKKNGRKFCNIKIAGCEEFQATLNHPFYARKKKVYSVHGMHRTAITRLLEPEWIKAEDLTCDYRVGIPINNKSVIPKWDGIVKYIYNQYGITKSWIENTLFKYMDNPDFWWLIGRYMGDGYVSKLKNMIDLCCAYKDIDIIKAVVDRLGIKYTTGNKADTFSFVFSNKELCEFVSQFGIGSLNKSITNIILDLPVDLLRSFLDGYISADGHWDNTNTNQRCRISTVSRNLAYGLQQCLLKAYGRYAGMTVTDNVNNVIMGRKVSTHKQYVLIFYKEKSNRFQYTIEDNVAWVNVKKCEIVNTEQKSVYTLSVEDDESFTVNNIAVHNCTSHSKAKGGQPRKHGLRILPWAVYEHAKKILPDVIIMENVEEIQDWGPLDEKGKPIPERKGEDYKKFITSMESIGYKFDSKELVAADYGAPTTRKRWYAIFRRDGKPIAWPESTHSKVDSNELQKWEPCCNYIDWFDLGKSIFDRKKPLKEATQKRIANGIKKYIINNPNPYFVSDKKATSFIIQYHGEQKNGESRGQLLTEPLRTIDTSNRYGLVTAFITKYYKTGIGQGCNEPLHTITTSPRHFGLVSAFLIKYYRTRCGQVLSEPLGIITTKDRFDLISVPLNINGEEYVIKDIFLRMLKPEELKLCQGFPKDYVIDRDYKFRRYPVSKQVARIGNSVVPIMAEALVKKNCPDLIVGERKTGLNLNCSGEQIKFVI